LQGEGARKKRKPNEPQSLKRILGKCGKISTRFLHLRGRNEEEEREKEDLGRGLQRGRERNRFEETTRDRMKEGMMGKFGRSIKQSSV